MRAEIRRPEVLVPSLVLALVVLACVLGPLLPGMPAATGGDVLDSSLPPLSPGHLLGTDPNGDDLLARVLVGGQTSLFVAAAVSVIGLVLGGGVGALSGYLGGRADSVIMRVLDVFIAFPSLVLVVAVAQSLGPSVRNTILALAAFSVPAFARVARAATVSLREAPFMTAAVLCGTPWWRTLGRHVVPNIAPQVLTFGLLGVGIVMVIEGALSYLGLGVPLPDPTWGNMISQGQAALAATPSLVVWPSIALFVTVLAVTVLGEVLRARADRR